MRWSLQACKVIKKRLQRRCFPVKFAKFLKTPFFTEHLRWLLLEDMFYKRLLEDMFYKRLLIIMIELPVGSCR